MTPGEEPTVEEAYDELADTYVEDVETSPYNANLAFPGTTALVPDVEGKRVLDAGCGSGAYTEWLLDRGAEVVAVDLSEAMLERANARVGVRAEFHRADLREPLHFAEDGAFDAAVCSLVLDYVEEWRPTFSEFSRLLEPGGSVVFSVSHPFDEYPLDDDENYFEVEPRTKEWTVEVPYYRRPLSKIFTPVIGVGFRIDAIAEPKPGGAFAARRPERYEKESRRPTFLCVRAVKR